MFRSFIHRFRAYIRSERTERGLEKELRFHLDMETAENIRRGMNEEEARLAALKSFGGVEQTKESYRDLVRFRRLENLWHDVNYSARLLWKQPGLTVVVMLTLALGIGANTAIFSVFNGLVLKPLPYEEPEHLVKLQISERPGLRYQSGAAADYKEVSPGGFHDWRERSRSFKSMTAYRFNSTIFADGDQTMYVVTLRVAARFFETYGVSAQLGRKFSEQDYDPTAPKTIILGDDLWRNHYGADPKVVGRTISLDGLPHHVIGVMPPDFWPNGSGVPRIWTPYWFNAEEQTDRSGNAWNVIARLGSGVAFDQAQTEMDALAAQLNADYPGDYKSNGIVLIPLAEAFARSLGNIGRVFVLLLWAVGLVLAIACVNIANLLLARAIEREREFAICAALGASRGRLFMRVLTESLTLAALGGAFGLLLGAIGTRLLTAMLGGVLGIPRVGDVHFNWQAFAYTAMISLTTGLLSGLIPAIRAARSDLSQALNERSRGGGRSKRLGKLLVITEVAAAMLLAVGAGLVVKSFRQLQRVDPGFSVSRLLTMRINTPDYKYGRFRGSKPGSVGVGPRIIIYKQIEERVGGLPGVESAAVAARLPITYTPELSAINITGRAQSDHSSGLENLAECKELLQKAGLPCHGAVGTNQVTAGYFHTLGVRLLRGRLFDERDQADAPLTTVLSETAARKYWPNEDPVGKRFTMNFSNWLPQYEIIGVVADIKTDGLNSPFTPEIYQSMSQTPSDDSELIIRTKGAPETFSTLVREEMKRFDRDIPLRNVRTMDDVIAGALWQSRLAAWLLGLFAALAALLAAAGLYGVMRYSISQRTNEIGIRMALGAQAADVLRMILREGAILLTVGMATGLVAAVALRRFLASYLFDVTATDPLTYIGVAALLAPAALLACYLPARSATKVDPLIALRRQ